jgi:hypothetical protein
MEEIYRALNDALNILQFSLDEPASDQFKTAAMKAINELSDARERFLLIDRALGPSIHDLFRR